MRVWRNTAPGRSRDAVRDDDFERRRSRTSTGLFSTAMRLTRNRAAAEDLVQETFLKAVRFSGRFERGTNLRAWLFTILHNTHRNARRGAGATPCRWTARRMEQRRSPPRPAHPGAGPAAVDAERRNCSRRSTRCPSLPQAVWLRDVEEFSYAENRRHARGPAGRVMSRIARGRRMLLQQVSRTRLAARR